MTELENNYLIGATFITYDNGLKGCVLVEGEKGVIPIELTDSDLAFIVRYPNIMTKLMEGKILYFRKGKAYIGSRNIVGPYGEQETFVSEYNSKNGDLYSLTADLERNIINGVPKRLILTKLGVFYNEEH